jgi:hypothetical protein
MTTTEDLHGRLRALALLSRQIDRQHQQATRHTTAEERAHAQGQMKRIGHEVWAGLEALQPVLDAAVEEGWLGPPPEAPTESDGG